MLIPFRFARPRFRLGLVGLAALLLVGNLVLSLTQVRSTSAASTSNWTATGSLNQARYAHTATLLPTGKVLVAGGINTSSGALASAELNDLSTGTWTATGSMTAARQAGHTATLLPTGKVLVAGGVTSGPSSMASAELFSPCFGNWRILCDR